MKLAVVFCANWWQNILIWQSPTFNNASHYITSWNTLSPLSGNKHPSLEKKDQNQNQHKHFLEQCFSFYQHSILIEGQKSKVYAKQKFCTKLFSQIIDGWQRKNKFLTLLHNKCMTNGVQFFMNLYSSRDNDSFCNEKIK